MFFFFLIISLYIYNKHRELVKGFSLHAWIVSAILKGSSTLLSVVEFLSCRHRRVPHLSGPVWTGQVHQHTRRFWMRVLRRLWEWLHDDEKLHGWVTHQTPADTKNTYIHWITSSAEMIWYSNMPRQRSFIWNHLVCEDMSEKLDLLNNSLAHLVIVAASESRELCQFIKVSKFREGLPHKPSPNHNPAISSMLPLGP